MAKLVRHRQTKGPETDMLNLKPPRHISTLQREKDMQRKGGSILKRWGLYSRVGVDRDQECA
jgi:hypothetical protein